MDFRKKFQMDFQDGPKGSIFGPKGPHRCSRRLQPSAGARKKPPVGRQFFQCLLWTESLCKLYETIGQMLDLKIRYVQNIDPYFIKSFKQQSKSATLFLNKLQLTLYYPKQLTHHISFPYQGTCATWTSKFILPRQAYYVVQIANIWTCNCLVPGMQSLVSCLHCTNFVANT